jgi:hypothetical protein
MMKRNHTGKVTELTRLPMNKNEILQLVKEHFDEEWCEEDGHGWVEFAGKPDAFVKFYRKAYSEGWREGNDEGYDDGCFQATGGN